jgi:hypothetical protein
MPPTLGLKLRLLLQRKIMRDAQKSSQTQRWTGLVRRPARGALVSCVVLILGSFAAEPAGQQPIPNHMNQQPRSPYDGFGANDPVLAARQMRALNADRQKSLVSDTHRDLPADVSLPRRRRPRNLLKRQQKIFFQISGAGHEALQVGAGSRPCVPATTGSSPTIAIARSASLSASPLTDMMLQAVGAADRPRQRRPPDAHSLEQPPAAHRQHLLLHRHPASPRRRLRRGRPLLQPPSRGRRKRPDGDYRAFHDVEFHGDEVVLACVGEGSTSQGEFWEALNTASNQKLPVIFCVEDNGYAISVPVEVNTPGGNISRLVANFPNFHFAEIDGTDPVSLPARLSGGSRALPRRPRPRLRPRPLACGLFALALRRRQALPLRRRARGRRVARPVIAKMQMRVSSAKALLTDDEINALEQSLRPRSRGGRRSAPWRAAARR